LPDLSRLDQFAFPDPDEMFVISDDTRRYLDGLDRSQCFVLGQQTYFLFERAWALMGMEAFMEAFHTNPGGLRRLLGRITDYNRRIFELYMELGCDGVSFSEDLGTQRSLMVSPSHFREFFLPEYGRAFEPVRAAGGMVNFHSCGCIMDIVDGLIELGVEILNPVQARANDLAELKRRCHGKMALMGGIDTQHVLMRGTPDDVTAEVRRVIDILAPGGGYICGPDQGMPFPDENIAALWRSAEEYNPYDQPGQ
jgi:uroporphyrinogen decarboxylase